jgi:soluble lytic murein transglycosylase-like protein
MRGGSHFLAVAALLAGAAFAAPAVAGTVYRCDGADGVRSYSSTKVKGARCTVASSYTSSPAHRAAPKASGSATPSSAASGSPAAASVPAAAKAPAAKPYQAPRLVEGQVYSYIKDGVRHYSSKRPAGASGATAMRTIRYSFLETCYACAPNPGVNFGNVRLNTAAYDAEVRAAAREYGVDEAIVRAIIHAESSFNPNALSRVGAQGLMQLMPATAQRFGVGNPFDPAQNIRGGVKYLSWLLKRFNGNLTLAAAGYNAGEGAVDRHKGVPPYKETQRYVQRVGVLADRYRGALAAR